jgi:hypothetical protein
MMYSQGLKLFYNRGLHFLVAKPTAASRLALVAQNARCFSLTNNQIVRALQQEQFKSYS